MPLILVCIKVAFKIFTEIYAMSSCLFTSIIQCPTVKVAFIINIHIPINHSCLKLTLKMTVWLYSTLEINLQIKHKVCENDLALNNKHF